MSGTDNRNILKEKNMTYRGRKIVNINKKMTDREEGAGKDKTNNKIKNQPDGDIYR